MPGKMVHPLFFALLTVFVRPAGGAADSIAVDLSDLTRSDSLEIELNGRAFADNLDSLVNLWYVGSGPGEEGDYAGYPEKKSLRPPVSRPFPRETRDSLRIAATAAPNPQFPDSVYIDRLSRLPVKIDLTYNKQVRNYIEVYTGKRRELVQVLLGLADYYFPMFDEIFDAHGIPLELKYCSVIESALNPRAVSRAGASGIWQFMYGTGRMYGLTINSLVDERRDPLKSTHAAARFMKDLYGIYGDWMLVIAAYNCGPGNVNRAIRRSGGRRDFWDIYYFLPRETRGHVPAFVAAAYTMNYYREHGLIPGPLHLPIPVDTIMIRENLHFDQVSHVLGIQKKILQDINPQYRWDIIPGSEKPYPLRIPVEYSMPFLELEDSIFAWNDSVYFPPGKFTRSPARYASSYVPDPPSPDMVRLSYTIKPGDNLGYISEWYRVRVSDLKNWNNIYGTTIRAGNKLTVFVPGNRADHYRKINTMSFAEKQRSIGKEVAEAQTGERLKLPEKDEDYVLYTIKSGDTLWDIAKKYPGVSDGDILKLNNLNNGNNIRPGMVIRIKPKE